MVSGTLILLSTLTLEMIFQTTLSQRSHMKKVSNSFGILDHLLVILICVLCSILTLLLIDTHPSSGKFSNLMSNHGLKLTSQDKVFTKKLTGKHGYMDQVLLQFNKISQLRDLMILLLWLQAILMEPLIMPRLPKIGIPNSNQLPKLFLHKNLTLNSKLAV
jgi:hypothetical protein